MESVTNTETVCNLLTRSRLMQPDDVRATRQRWLREAGDAVHDPARFCKWLVSNQYITDYQAGRLLKGHTDHYYFNDYKLLDCIGKGRMAGVYKAVHRLGQAVAIKVLPPSKAKDKEAFGRFHREARIALRLKHANVVRTFHADHADAINYIVMEYLDGETLEEVLTRRGRLPPEEVVRIIYQALTGLQHIHEIDVVHRDLKPANLMLVPAPAPGQPDNTLNATVKVLDVGLGLALFEEGTPAGNVNLTAEGSVLGTPDYLAPEQARDAHTADIRADIYSLGCVLYHCLAGQVPFPDKNPIRKMVAHASQQAAPLRGFNPEVSDELQAIVARMMAKDPTQRFATPKQAAQALQVYLQNRKVAYDSAMAILVPSYVQWVESAQGGQVAVADAGEMGVELVAVGPAPKRSGRRLIVAGGVIAIMGGAGWWLAKRLFGK